MARPRKVVEGEVVVTITRDGVFPFADHRCDAGDVVTVSVETAEILEKNGHAKRK